MQFSKLDFGTPRFPQLHIYIGSLDIGSTWIDKTRHISISINHAKLIRATLIKKQISNHENQCPYEFFFIFKNNKTQYW